MIKKLILVSRPISWVNTAYPYAAAYLISERTFDLRLILGFIFFLIPYNLLMYGVNDVFDYESDLHNPRKGGIEGALATKSTHKTIIWTSMLSCLPFIVYLVATESLISTITLFAVLFLVIAYSAPVLRFKERPIIDSMTSSAHFTGPLIFALSFVNFPIHDWPYVVSFFLWGMASHAFGAVQDIIPDKKGGIASIATYIGAKETVRLAALLYATAVIVLFTQGGLAIVAGFIGLIYIVNIYPYLSINEKTAEKTNKAWRRFIYINYFSGAVITMLLLAYFNVFRMI